MKNTIWMTPVIMGIRENSYKKVDTQHLKFEQSGYIISSTIYSIIAFGKKYDVHIEL